MLPGKQIIVRHHCPHIALMHALGMQAAYDAVARYLTLAQRSCSATRFPMTAAQRALLLLAPHPLPSQHSLDRAPVLVKGVAVDAGDGRQRDVELLGGHAVAGAQRHHAVGASGSDDLRGWCSRCVGKQNVGQLVGVLGWGQVGAQGHHACSWSRWR